MASWDLPAVERDHAASARARFKAQASPGLWGTLWWLWKAATYDVAHDDQVPMHIREQQWADRQW